MQSRPCPICGSELSRLHFGGEHGTEEEHENCNAGCQQYHYEFCYGSFMVTIGHNEYGWHHTTPQAEKARVQDAIQAKINEIKNRITNESANQTKKAS